jgi:Domain of unknown function (DUF4180)
MQPEQRLNLHGMRVLQYGTEGPRLQRPQDALDIIGHALGSEAAWVVLPSSRLATEFFDLQSGLAGETVQKFANYQVALVVLGDVSPYGVKSEAFKAFVLEANAGKALWFSNSMQEFERRLLGG